VKEGDDDRLTTKEPAERKVLEEGVFVNSSSLVSLGKILSTVRELEQDGEEE
jgi:hypothetical protein